MFTLAEENRHGFTLIELLIAIALSIFIVLAIYNLFLSQKKAYSIQEQVIETQQNARMAMHLLTKDLRMIGYGIDIAHNQPKLVYCGPYQLTFNADLDSTRGTINTSLSPNKVPSAPAASFTGTYIPIMTYSGGAETIRWSLDSNNNGLITNADKDSTTSGNPRDFALIREEFGSKGGSNGGNNVAIALGLRGPGLVDNDGDGANDANTRAIPLFQYWGDFAGDGAPYELWGDDGSGGSTANNGILEQGEIEGLAAVTDVSQVKRIVITITAETLRKDPEWQDNGGYRKTILVSTVTPRNLGY
jgi:prepilin-type N-terminal cleavage/methylation domain-containing protein